MGNIFCSNCNKKVNYSIRKNVIQEYKGQIVNIEENIAVCDECGKDIFVPDIENDNLKRLYAKYAKLTGIISSEEIIKFREKYDLSQRELVSLLGWGKMTINRYERGALPSKSHSDILKHVISSEESLKQKVKEAYEAGRINEKVYNKLANSFQSSKINIIKSLLEIELSHEEDILNGFRKFNLDKVENLISYIADKVDNLYKTSLNKYLWFIDFENFKENVRSITGLTYVKQQYGPVIENKGYEEIINLLEDKFYKEETEDVYNNSTKVKIKSKGNYDMNIFTKEERVVIDAVINKFKDMKVSKISDESHKEAGWIENDINNIISYDYAEALKMNFS
jgi:putative zinc finger/helix-turn-helix YgiT family protein